eukprot:gb/GECH01011249.1/.p1 GENE.gb/GECH01011249.1/~~gb/GECH01011249.1/.p1  ORF type:complete len:155 (+),score=31.31 gb/GECH01011249.1/:1-465(+)
MSRATNIFSSSKLPSTATLPPSSGLQCYTYAASEAITTGIPVGAVMGVGYGGLQGVVEHGMKGKEALRFATKQGIFYAGHLGFCMFGIVGTKAFLKHLNPNGERVVHSATAGALMGTVYASFYFPRNPRSILLGTMTGAAVIGGTELALKEIGY